MSNFNNSGTPLRILGNSLSTGSGFKISVAIINGRRLVHGYTVSGGLSVSKLSVTRTSAMVRIARSPNGVLGRCGGSSVTMNLAVLGGNRNSTFISTNSANTLIVNTAFVIGQLGNVGEYTLTAIVPALGGPYVVLSYKTGTRMEPRVLGRFTLVNSTCVGGLVNIRGPQVTLTGVNARPGGNERLRIRTCRLLDRSGLGFMNGVRTERIPVKSTSMIMASNFSNGVLLGSVRNVTGFFTSSLGRVLATGTLALIKTLFLGKGVGNFGGGVSCGRCNNTPLLNSTGPMFGTRNSSSTGTFYGTVERTGAFIRGGMVRRFSSTLSTGASSTRWL